MIGVSFFMPRGSGDKQQVREKYEHSKTEIKELKETFREKGSMRGASYRENLPDRLFKNVGNTLAL
jgi:hypothetical protein